MPYNKTEWQNKPSKASPISADALNNLETQYDQAVADAVAQAFTDATTKSNAAKTAAVSESETSYKNYLELVTYGGLGTTRRLVSLDPVTLLPNQAVIDALRGAVSAEMGSPGSTVDVMPTIQALRDAGIMHIDFIPGQIYYFNSVVFCDSADPRSTLILNTKSARINIGPNAGATVTEYRGTAGTRFLFIVNTKRTAYNSSTKVVTTTEGNTATGSFVATVGPGLVVKDMDFRGNNQLIRVAHGNNTTLKLLGGRTSNMNGGIGTRGYCDSNEINFRLTNPFGDSPSHITQGGNGDNLVVSGNADARALICDIQYTRGAHFLAPVGGGMRFLDSANVVITGGHIEGDEHLRVAPCLQVIRSQVTVMGTEFWSSNTEKTFHTILVNDGSTAADTSTDLLLQNVVSRNIYRTDSVVDERQMSDLHIMNMNVNSRIRARGYLAGTQVVSLNDLWRTSPLITSDISAIQTAINNGQALIATGNWDLVRRDNAWKIVPPENPDLLTARAATLAPTVDAASQYSAVPGAVMPGTYNYYFASIDEFGNYGPRTLASNVVVSTAGGTTVRAIVNVRRPGRLAVWRQLEGGAIDRYAVVGVAGVRMFLHDTGTNINKRAWQTSGIPDRPSTDPAASVSVDAMRFNGKTITLT